MKKANRKKGVVIVIMAVLVVTLLTTAGYFYFTVLQSASAFEWDEISNNQIEITNYKGDEAEVEIPETIYFKKVTSIGDFAFSGCTSTEIENVTIPDSVTCICVSAFYNCTSLTSVTIPDSVTIIGEEAFYNCTSLTDVYYGGSEADWNRISICVDNSELTSATIHYNSN